MPASWSECTEYLYGVDLFNQVFLWEAHEAWEVVWIGAGKTTEPASLVQGLIQVSAALLRTHLGTPRGAHNLVTRAWKRLDAIEGRLARTGRRTYMGIALEPWRRSVEDFVGGRESPYPVLLLEE